jgi:uncharacterized protein Yka (UPF0111/DUF47 family)
MNAAPNQLSRRTRWWHRIIGKDDKFYDLLRAAAEEARTSVGLLSTFLEKLRQGATVPDLNEIAESRRRQKRIRTETVEELNKTLVPPFDREDIQALAFALYRIPKVVEKIVERMSIYPGRIPHEAFQRQVELLTITADALLFMVNELLAGGHIEKVTAANARLQAAEGEADKMMLTLLQELYQGTYTAKELVILQSFYELMERAVDRCRNAGTIVMRIMLKSA